MNPKNMENDMFDTMWGFLEIGGGLTSNYASLKEYCLELRQLMKQKTAGQRKNKPHDISFDDLPRVKNLIIIEAMCLVLSGDFEEFAKELDEKRGEKDE